MYPYSRVLFASVALALASMGQTIAADYEPPIYVEQAPEYVPVEVGSGWYLRGDIGYNFARDYTKYDFADPDLVDPLVQEGFGETQTTVGGTVGIGYHFNDIFRADVNVGLLSSSKANVFGTRTNGCDVTQTVTVVTYDINNDPIDPPDVTTGPATADCYSESTAESSAWTGMANVYADLGTVAGFTPYVGAGLGLVYTPVKANINDRICSASETNTSVSGVSETTVTQLCEGQNTASDADVDYPGTTIDRNKVSLLYSLGAGVSYRMSENASIDVGYNWITAPGAEYVTLRNDEIVIAKGMDIHQVKVGVRYDLW